MRSATSLERLRATGLGDRERKEHAKPCRSCKLHARGPRHPQHHNSLSKPIYSTSMDSRNLRERWELGLLKAYPQSPKWSE